MHRLGDRPAWVEAEIDRRYEYASSEEVLGDYGFNGERADYMALFGSSPASRNLTLGTIVDRLASERGRALRTIELGTAAGGVLQSQLKAGHDAQGVTALDYRTLGGKNARLRSPYEFSDRNYIVGDVHRLDRLPVHGEADVVSTRLCLMHLVDPLAVLADAASRVARGGLLVTDAFAIPSQREDESALHCAVPLVALKAGGFVPYNDEAASRIEHAMEYGDHMPRLVMRRVHDGAVEVDAYYSPQPEQHVYYYDCPQV